MSDVEEGQALEEEQKEEEVGGYYKQGIQQNNQVVCMCTRLHSPRECTQSNIKTSVLGTSLCIT